MRIDNKSVSDDGNKDVVSFDKMHQFDDNLKSLTTSTYFKDTKKGIDAMMGDYRDLTEEERKTMISLSHALNTLEFLTGEIKRVNRERAYRHILE